MNIVEITQQPIALFQLLKFSGVVSSGGEAKLVIADGLVRVNGIVETRKRKKLVSGDTVAFGTEKIQIRAATEAPVNEVQS